MKLQMGSIIRLVLGVQCTEVDEVLKGKSWSHYKLVLCVR